MGHLFVRYYIYSFVFKTKRKCVFFIKTIFLVSNMDVLYIHSFNGDISLLGVNDDSKMLVSSIVFYGFL